MKDHGSPEATGDEMPREDGFEFHFILALHSLSDEEGDPGEDGQKEENEGNRGCPGISSATFFQRGNQEDGGGEEYSSAGEIDLPDGSHAEFGVGMFRSAHERNIVRHEQEDESERDDPGWNAEINESIRSPRRGPHELEMAKTAERRAGMPANLVVGTISAAMTKDKV
ncbi:MAG: hypothetical protein L6R38_005406 [Xanthoria sp. 2 TBL-2021]|nr:MAG: hypothetical protein L6R38_005406 [Xanthoria sp. 2 TBL-2021]